MGCYYKNWIWLAHPLTLGCLIIKFQSFIHFAFDEIILILQLGHRFCVLSQLDSRRGFSIFSGLYFFLILSSNILFYRN